MKFENKKAKAEALALLLIVLEFYSNLSTRNECGLSVTRYALLAAT